MFPTGDDSHPKSVAVGDFNHDDNLDIVVANSGTNNIDILLGDGSGNFSLEQIYPTGDNSKPSSIALGDFNSDNHLDIVVANSQADNIIIFCGYGNGTMALLRTYSTEVGSTPSSIVVRNLNADGYLDIIVSNYGSNDVLVFYGFNNGTFLEPKSYTLGYNSRPQSVAIGDINNDNFLDIVVANSGTDYVEILLQKCMPFNN
jgi:predicted nucleotidyltransferase